MRIDIVTIFPEYFTPLDLSLVGKARVAGVLDIGIHDLRQYATDRHHTVDDSPYGGGAGMVMKPDVWGDALDAVLPPGDAVLPPGDAVLPPRDDDASGAPHLLIPSPSGRVFDQAMATEMAEDLVAGHRLVFGCGRYEGIDARVVDEARTRMRVTEVSIGDYVLNGGEVAALVIIEAVARLVPGIVGNPESLVEESHGEDGLLEYPVYTKPPTWRGRSVPDVLVSGHHANIARWRRDQALRRTVDRRPDLVAGLDPERLDDQDRAVLDELGFRPGAGPVAK